MDIVNLLTKKRASCDMVPHNRKRHVSAIVSNNRVISLGYNFSVHAEEDALKKYFMKAPKCNVKVDLVVLRLNKSGRLMNSKPCKNCLLKIKQVNIRYVLLLNRTRRYKSRTRK